MQYKPIKTKTNNEEYIKNSENTKKKRTKRIYIDKIVVYKPIKKKRTKRIYLSIKNTKKKH
jgi:hypothetical protein